MNQIVKFVLIIGFALVMLFVGLPFLSRFLWGQTNTDSYMTGAGMWGCSGWGSNWGLGGGWIMLLLMVIVWAIIIWGIVSLIQGFLHSDRSGSGVSNQNLAMEILKKRYAAGEIDRDEYKARKRDLD